MYSSKTYYQEEIYKREKLLKQLQVRVDVLERKKTLIKQHKKISGMMAAQDYLESESSEPLKDS